MRNRAYVFDERIMYWENVFELEWKIMLPKVFSFSVHKKFIKNQKNVKPSPCVMLCDQVGRKNNKVGLIEIF
jgi:hypothetical protein